MTRRRLTALASSLTLLGAAAAAAATTATGAPAGPAGVTAPTVRGAAGPDSGSFPGAQVPLGDSDARGPLRAPLAGATAEVARLGAGVSASWTQYGTAKSLTRDGGWLATGLTGSPSQAARAFVADHAALFGLSASEVGDLELWRDTVLPGSDAHAVLFRQHVAGMPLAEDGLISVGVRGGSVAGVTSSAVPSTTLNTRTPALSPEQAVLAAAHDAGLTALSAGDLRRVGAAGTVDKAGFTHVAARGLAQQQLTRLAALPMTSGPARLAWETDVSDVAGGLATAATSFVDATDGRVLLRRDAVDTAAAGSAGNPALRSVSLPTAAPAGPAPTPGTFVATYTATGCGPRVPLTVPAASASLAVVANGVNPGDDFVLNVYRGGASIGTSDTATSPEAVTATLTPPSTATDTFSAEICPSPNPLGPFVGPFTVAGAYVAAETPLAATTPGTPTLPIAGSVSAPPTFKFFQANPVLGLQTVGLPAADNRSTGCGTRSTDMTGSKSTAGCQIFFNTVENPTVYDTQNGVPTFATLGNNAVTTNAQDSTSLTPGAPATPYTSPTRDYAPTFTDQWKTAKCDPTSLLTPQQGDINASITNLFTGHNRIHDFAYRLGLNDSTGSLQTTNGSGAGVAGDPELGNAQNAAITNLAIVTASGTTGESVPVTGRNNANQITLQDGVPGITNQYLFQPIVGFAGPCADGDLDSSVFLHEYTHAISNRLIAGPNTGLSGRQGGSMGESWSDLDAIEFLNAFGVAGKGGEDRYAEGAYVTGDKVRGIRDYNLLDNPLTYGEFGFDTTGPEVHADGEIWNAAQMHMRQALIDSWNGKGIPDSDVALQKACALGERADGSPAPTFDGCPGNRRWIHYLYDSLILQANGTPTFVDMKNATLASVLLRNPAGAASDDYRTVSEAFAQRGLGANSASPAVSVPATGNTAATTIAPSDNTDPVPGFASPTAADNARVTFDVVDEVTGAKVPAQIYVGTYSARATPLATTIAGQQPATADMVGSPYSFVVRAPGYGLQRFTASYADGQVVAQTFRVARNLASAASGASVVAPGSVRPGELIDDNEGTNTGYDGTAAATPVAGRAWTIALGGSRTVQRLSISALHHPLDAAASSDFQGRIIDLRAFDVQASSDGGASYGTVYSSPDDFFPGRRPRTLAPDVALRSVTLPAAVTADHLRLVARSNQCTGAPDFRGDQDADPTSSSDCPVTPNAFKVTVAEFEAFGPRVDTATPGAPVTAPGAATAVTPKKTAVKKVAKKVVKKGAPKKAPAAAVQPTRTLAFTGLGGALGATGIGLLGGLGVLLVARRRLRRTS